VKLVNLKQSKEVRRLKYSLLRYVGFSRPEAARVRDYDWSHFKRFISECTPIDEILKEAVK